MTASRLKNNSKLIEPAEDKTEDLRKAVNRNIVPYAVTYGEFMYQAGSWSNPRRIVFKIEKPEGQMDFSWIYDFLTMQQLPLQIRVLGNTQEHKTAADTARTVTVSMYLDSSITQHKESVDKCAHFQGELYTINGTV